MCSGSQDWSYICVPQTAFTIYCICAYINAHTFIVFFNFCHLVWLKTFASSLAWVTLCSLFLHDTRRGKRKPVWAGGEKFFPNPRNHSDLEGEQRPSMEFSHKTPQLSHHSPLHIHLTEQCQNLILSRKWDTFLHVIQSSSTESKKSSV